MLNLLQKVEEFWKDPAVLGIGGVTSNHAEMLVGRDPKKGILLQGKENYQQQQKLHYASFDRNRRYHSSLSLHKSSSSSNNRLSVLLERDVEGGGISVSSKNPRTLSSADLRALNHHISPQQCQINRDGSNSSKQSLRSGKNNNTSYKINTYYPSSCGKLVCRSQSGILVTKRDFLNQRNNNGSLNSLNKSKSEFKEVTANELRDWNNLDSRKKSAE
jgi:hypothetical protein